MKQLGTGSHLASAPHASLPDSPSGFPAVYAQDEPNGPDWGRVRQAVYRHRWLVVAITLGATAAGAAATRFLKPLYMAQAMVWIDQDARRGNDVMPIRPNQSFDAAAWTDLVRSYQVLDTVVSQLRLNSEFDADADSALVRTFAVSPGARPGDYLLKVERNGAEWSLYDLTHVRSSLRLIGRQGPLVDHGAATDSIGSRLGMRWTIPRGTSLRDGETLVSIYTPRDASRRLDDALQVSISPEGNFLKLKLAGPDPNRIAAILNALANRFVAVAADLRRQKLSEMTRILGARAAEASKALATAENQFQSYRVNAITLPEDPASIPSAARAGGGVPTPAVTDYFQLQQERDRVGRTRAALDRVTQNPAAEDAASRLAELESVQKDAELKGMLDTLRAKRAELRALASRYSDAHPLVQRLQAEIDDLQKASIPGLARRLSESLGQRQSEIDRQLASQTTTLRAMPPRAVEGTRLRRNVETSENLYTSLQGRYDAARVAEESSVSDARVLDAAVAPEVPDKNNRARIILIALVGGLSLGLAFAVGLDRIDPKVRYPAQVSNEMGLTILGALPHLARHTTNGKGVIGDAAMVEALRGIRLTVAYAFGTSSPMVFSVSSPGSSDGKSFLAANLARAFAENGRRVVVVDGDLRRGVLHRRVAVQRRPGFADFLMGEAGIDEIVHHTSHAGLDVVPCGTRAQNAPELLGRGATAQLLAQLRSRYDVVICDSPPLSAGIDSFVLAAATGNLLVVLRTGVSHREMATAKLDILDRMPVRLLGAVLNDVPEGTVYSYYSYYLPGYEATDEKSNVARPSVLI